MPKSRLTNQLNNERRQTVRVVFGSLLFNLILTIVCGTFPGIKQDMLSPIPEGYQPVFVAQASEVVATPKPEVGGQPTHTGIASFYSRSGCVGCSSTMTMANGKPLDDSKLTVAFNRAKLNSQVKITNLKTGDSVVATVTDRGGFEKPKFNVKGKQRIVDMTIATRDAINCSHLCDVTVELIK